MKKTLAGGRWVVLAVSALTVLGLALRLARYQQTVFGDELSTLYIVEGRSLADVMDYVSGDAEITPPLYFVLAWMTTKLGSAPELVRLPSLVAGTVSIPLVYLLGARTLSRPAGLIAAAVMALSPFMIFYSADGRGYAVAIAFLLSSTLAMLAGARTGRARWWAAYGAFSLLAIYTHYTAAFVLAAQLLWLLWAHPRARGPALIANACTAVLYLPWAPGLLADGDSPTTEVLYAIQGSGLAVKVRSIGSWLVGYPYRTLSDFLGLVPALVGAAGFATAAAVGLSKHLRARSALRDSSPPPLISPGMALALALALSNVVLALLFLLVTGNDLLSARSFVTASAGPALLIGGVIVSAGRRWGAVSAVLVIACFAVGAANTLSTANELPDFKSAASYIDAEADPDDVIVDLMLGAGVTPVPLTPLDAYLEERTRPEFRIQLPEGEPPFLPQTPVPATADLLRAAVREAEGHSLIVLARDENLVREGKDVSAIRVYPFLGGSTGEDFELPPGSRVVAERKLGGLDPFEVVTIDVGDQ